ncbi:hypothetical protein E2C01_060953 [Portunus trituberculatus]|uniref:Uncharacterized protein n=1 Tax=Portunus trituberculatus TaxID=210409 RepID=A0A5B7H3Z1_PORTR|nr:hypothetical protein [Portunus trituberculatus]
MKQTTPQSCPPRLPFWSPKSLHASSYPIRSAQEPSWVEFAKKSCPLWRLNSVLQGRKEASVTLSTLSRQAAAPSTSAPSPRVSTHRHFVPRAPHFPFFSVPRIPSAFTSLTLSCRTSDPSPPPPCLPHALPRLTHRHTNLSFSICLLITTSQMTVASFSAPHTTFSFPVWAPFPQPPLCATPRPTSAALEVRAHFGDLQRTMGDLVWCGVGGTEQNPPAGVGILAC